jgi:Spy/CpxP family protein refolding chaperone
VRIPVWFVAAVVVVVSLLTGVVVGVAVDRRVLLHRGTPWTGRDVGRDRWHSPMGSGRLGDELGLSPQQRAAVDSVMHHRMAQRDSLMSKTFPVMRALLDSTRADIERLLTPEQKEKFEKLRMRDRSMGGQRGMIGRGPGGPGSMEPPPPPPPGPASP